MNNLIKEFKTKFYDEKILLAVSCGSDSMCLLNLLIRSGLKDNLVIAHVNHGVREESKIEEEYIKEYCSKNNIVLEVAHFTFDTSNFEEEARIKRYSFFKETYDKYRCDVLMLAHNASDNLETIIMRLIKSSSLKAYAGISKGCVNYGMYIYRPLLNTPKDDILLYNKQNNVKYFDDVTNFSDDHLRNRIRKYITPVLLKENPNLYESIDYYSKTHFEASEFIEYNVKSFIKEFVKNIDGDICIPYNEFIIIDPYIRKEVLFTLLKKENLSYRQIEQIHCDIICSKTKIINALKNITFIKEYGNVIFTKKDISKKEFCLDITEDGEYLIPRGKLIVENNNVCFIDKFDSHIWYNNISKPFRVRNILDGDKIERISKDKKYNQLVNNILTTKKISAIIKGEITVIEKDGKIQAIVGFKIK